MLVKALFLKMNATTVAGWIGSWWVKSCRQTLTLPQSMSIMRIQITAVYLYCILSSKCQFFWNDDGRGPVLRITYLPLKSKLFEKTCILPCIFCISLPHILSCVPKVEVSVSMHNFMAIGFMYAHHCKIFEPFRQRPHKRKYIPKIYTRFFVLYILRLWGRSWFKLCIYLKSISFRLALL